MELPELLIKLYDTQVPCVAVGRNTNTDWRCPDDAANEIDNGDCPKLDFWWGTFSLFDEW